MGSSPLTPTNLRCVVGAHEVAERNFSAHTISEQTDHAVGTIIGRCSADSGAR